MGEVGGVFVRDRPREVLGKVQEQRASLGDVEQLHAATDAEDRHVAGADVLGEQPVEILAARLHHPDRRVGHVAVATGIEVAAPDEHHAVEPVEHLHDVVLVGQRRQDHGQAAGGEDAVVVAGRDERERGVLLAGGAEIRVDTDEGLGCHRSPP